MEGSRKKLVRPSSPSSSPASVRLAVSLLFLPHLHEVKKVTPHRPLWMYPRSLVRKKYRL